MRQSGPGGIVWFDRHVSELPMRQSGHPMRCDTFFAISELPMRQSGLRMTRAP